MREIVRHVQNARKNAGLEVDDRIELTLTTEDKALKQAIEEHAETIQAETLATKLHTKAGASAYEENVKLDGAELQISLSAI
jgi:isoleucyl-tRNA synthetase